MKKILIILPFIPYPLKTGGIVGVFEMINYLRNKHEISLIIPVSNSEDLNDIKNIWPNVSFHFYKKDKLKKKIFRKLSKILFGISLRFLAKSLHDIKENFTLSSLLFDATAKNVISPFLLDVNYNLIKLTNKLISENNYDVVQIEYVPLLPLICFIPKKINTIFVHHELRYVTLERMMEITEMNQDGYGLNKLILSLFKGQEIELLKLYKKILTVSEVDKKYLSADIDEDRIFVSPLTIRINPENQNNYFFDNKLFFLGGANHAPNVDAIKWFLENCWETLLAKNNKLKLLIIGIWSDKHKESVIKYKQVEFLDFVENLATVLKNGIMIVPIKIGSGMRMKIIDAVNYGIPFVTTKVGVEGLEFINERDCFIADTAELFVESLQKLIDSEVFQNKFIRNSKQLLTEKYSYERLTKLREQIYNIS